MGRTPKLLDILYIAIDICCVALRCFWLSLTNPIMMSRLHNWRARNKTRRRTERAEEERISRLHGQRSSSPARVFVRFQGHSRGDRLRHFHRAIKSGRADKSLVCFSVSSSLTLESRVQQVATTTVLPTNQTTRRIEAKNRGDTDRVDKSRRAMQRINFSLKKERKNARKEEKSQTKDWAPLVCLITT